MEKRNTTLLWILAVPAFAIAYYFGVALPANNEARLALERQKYADEQRQRQADVTRSSQAADRRQQALDGCLARADEAYWTHMRLNGTELKDGKIQARQDVWNTADRRKNDERDACFKRYPTQ